MIHLAASIVSFVIVAITAWILVDIAEQVFKAIVAPVLGFIAAVFALYLLFKLATSGMEGFLTSVLLISLVVLFVWWEMHKNKKSHLAIQHKIELQRQRDQRIRDQRIESQKSTLRAHVANHLDVLRNTRNNILQKDVYGITPSICHQRWEAEILYFVKEVAKISENGVAFSGSTPRAVIERMMAEEFGRKILRTRR